MATATETIGSILKRIEKERGLTISAAQRDLGVARQTYYHWRDDYHAPGLDKVKKIAQWTGEPEGKILSIILKANGINDYDVHLKEKAARRSANLRARHSGAIPGYSKWVGGDTGLIGVDQGQVAHSGYWETGNNLPAFCVGIPTPRARGLVKKRD